LIAPRLNSNAEPFLQLGLGRDRVLNPAVNQGRLYEIHLHEAEGMLNVDSSCTIVSRQARLCLCSLNLDAESIAAHLEIDGAYARLLEAEQELERSKAGYPKGGEAGYPKGGEAVKEDGVVSSKSLIELKAAVEEATEEVLSLQSDRS